MGDDFGERGVSLEANVETRSSQRMDRKGAQWSRRMVLPRDFQVDSA